MSTETTPAANLIDTDSAIAEALKLIAAHMNPVAQAEALAKAQKKAIRPQNQFSPKISALNPQGDKDYPRPRLPYEKIFVPYEAEQEDFTWEELELMTMLETGVYEIKRNDNSKIQIAVEITTNQLTKKPEHLFILSEIGFNNENRPLMPPLANVLRQILGSKAKGVLTMEERRELVASGDLLVSVGA